MRRSGNGLGQTGYRHQSCQAVPLAGCADRHDDHCAILLGDDRHQSDALRHITAPGVGLVAPLDPYRFGWLENRTPLSRLAHRLPDAPPAHPLLFPIGNMFWTRARVVQRMNALFGPAYPWPNEPLPNDGTEFHLIERLWPTLAAMEGLESLFLEKADQPRA